jgi:hypothetical protein
VSSDPLLATPVYGLRTWTVTGRPGEERLAGPQRRAPWPVAGAWLEASCPNVEGHAAPAPGCDCGIHAWHPRPRAARRIFSTRREVPGVVEASGAIEVHEEGFRAERARPYALFLAPGRNAGLAQRLAAVYEVPVVEVGGADDVLRWCSERGLGLAQTVVADLLGVDELAARRRARRTAGRANALRIAAAIVIAVLLVLVGLIATDDPGDRTLSGRAGEVNPR